MIKTLIIDDEPLAVEILETYVKQISGLELIGTCHNAMDANAILNTQEVDLILIDIQMPQMSGIELIKSLRHPPKVIFTTAYPEFAIQGFELDAIDYLLKPIDFNRFLKAVNKVFQGAFNTDKSKETFNSTQEFIFVKADKKLIKLNYEDILFIEGLKDYVIIYTDQTRIVTLQTMKSLEDKLPEHFFVRVHRSYIVNVHKINSIHSDDIEIILKNQSKLIPIGNNYSENINKIISAKRI
ncbi:MAG: response regulator transcription factor [Saprospiraceae bacterium]|nr:response regulator transcription factor [Saprospiraceae bacterium]